MGVLLKRLFTKNDDPHNISLGIGLGVLLGIMPGTGPVAALVVAQVLRVNRAAAFFGALLTNTWFSFVVLGLSAKIGANILSVNLADLNQNIQGIFRPFSLDKLLKLSFSQVILPLFTGFIVVSIALASAAYIVSFLALHAHRRLKNHKTA